MSQGDTGGRRLPSVFYNTTTVAGLVLTVVSLGLILFLMALEATSRETHPYMGIVAFVMVPPFVVLGLVLMGAGAARESWRRRHGRPATQRLPRINLNDPRHRRALVLSTSAVILFITFSAFGSYQAYEYTESNAFCGTTCHTPMHPEYTTYQQSPHARVSCVQCHIGPGAEWFVRSKLSGVYQVYAVLTDRFPRPIPTPIENLRPARDTCEGCHWPAWFAGDSLLRHDYFLSDEDNTHVELALLVNVGGGDPRRGERAGIHWHMELAKKVEYAATDEKRLEIPWVRATDPDGNVKTYVAEGQDFSEADAEAAGIRTMDCLDCHNRPAHSFHAPARLVNELIAQGRIAKELPGVKRIAVEALEGGYESQEAAAEGIAAHLRGYYEAEHPDLAAERAGDLDEAVAAVQEAYRINYFPTMNASWKDYPEHLGHLWWPGCFRCHDGNHVAEDGSVISNDCNLCHTFLAEDRPGEPERVALPGVEFRHPVDVGGAWQFMPCTDCHAP